MTGNTNELSLVKWSRYFCRRLLVSEFDLKTRAYSML